MALFSLMLALAGVEVGYHQCLAWDSDSSINLPTYLLDRNQAVIDASRSLNNPRNMSRRALRPRADVCHLCDFVLSRQSFLRHAVRTPKPINIPRTNFPSSRRPFSQHIRRSELQSKTASRSQISVRDTVESTVTKSFASDTSPEQAFADVKATIKHLLSLERIPSEGETAQALQQCGRLARLLMMESSLPYDRKDRAAAALLFLDDSAARKGSPLGTGPKPRNLHDELSKLAYSVMLHPPVFITPDILRLYVELQASLKKPETLPEIFGLYAKKAVPEEGSLPVKYSSQNPNKVANAIPRPTADLALKTAVEAKKLIVAMDLIESSYATKAFRRAKFVRKGLVPAAGVAIAPLAAYTLASQLAVLQTTMETGMATNVAFAGMLAYVGFTATIGVVAVTTANDQMDRVTWAPGIPLRERWIREEERAAIDKVACAWGFQEIWRRGEEEGEEWDALREWIGLKGMILDRTELMEGME